MKSALKMKTKEDIFENTIMTNIRRKSVYVDQVQLVDGKPLFSWININPTELCNRKCEFCPRVDPDLYPNQNLNMKLELGQKIADELKSFDYRGGVVISGYGEPLLYKDIVKLVEAFGEEVHTEIVTNGDKLDDDLVQELFEAGLDILVVSMYDGPHQIEHFKEMFANASIAEDQYVLRDRWYSAEVDYGVKLTNRAGTVKYGHQEIVDTTRPCYYTHYSMTIDWNGDVMLCDQDWVKKVKFGNVFGESLWDIWNSTHFHKFRRALLNGKRVMAPCNNCNVNGTLHGYNHAKVWLEGYEGKSLTV